MESQISIADVFSGSGGPLGTLTCWQSAFDRHYILNLSNLDGSKFSIWQGEVLSLEGELPKPTANQCMDIPSLSTFECIENILFKHGVSDYMIINDNEWMAECHGDGTLISRCA